MKIVSLLPSATEIICSIGLRSQLIGVSHECDYPASVRGLPVVTRSLIDNSHTSAAIDELVREKLATEKALYSLKMDVLEELQPDLIVTQALCDVCAVAGSEVEAAVDQLPGSTDIVNLEPSSLSDVFDTMILLGRAADCLDQAKDSVLELKTRVEAVQARSATIPEKELPRVAVLEWLYPLFNAGHWTPELVNYAGGVNCLSAPNGPSTTIQWADLQASDPDVILIALCGFDVERSIQDVDLLRDSAEWNSLRAVRNGKVYISDGNAYFSRSGPRLVDSLELLGHALHPTVHPLTTEQEGLQFVNWQ